MYFEHSYVDQWTPIARFVPTLFTHDDITIYHVFTANGNKVLLNMCDGPTLKL